jgi:hypothetical protein
MRLLLRAATGLLAAPLALLSQAALAQLAVAPVDGTTISAGGGIQFLWLPDIKFTGIGKPGNFRFQTNSDFTEYGPAVDAKIETPLGFWGASRVTGSVKGFWSTLDETDIVGCANKCVVVDPANTLVATGQPLITSTNRDVDYWGAQLEAKFWSPNQVQVRPRLMRTRYLMVGADVRGIDQDNDLFGSSKGHAIFKYNEKLDTTYYGGYVGIGGEYSLGFLGAGGIWEALGLRSYFEARAGLYDAQTDYSGSFAYKFVPISSRLSLSNVLSFETRKQFSPRASLSLWTDYELISSVPEMSYSKGKQATSIDDDWAYGSRTMLRLNIGLGPAPLYPPQ